MPYHIFFLWPTWIVSATPPESYIITSPSPEAASFYVLLSLLMAGCWELVPAARKGTARNAASETAGWARALLQICSYTHIFQKAAARWPNYGSDMGQERPGGSRMKAHYFFLQGRAPGTSLNSPKPLQKHKWKWSFRKPLHLPKALPELMTRWYFSVLLNQQSTAWNLAGWQTLADRHSRRRAGHSKSIS